MMAKGKKDAVNEDKSNPKIEKDEKNSSDEPLKRGKKRKVEKKETEDLSIAEELKNINKTEPETESSILESPLKKRNASSDKSKAEKSEKEKNENSEKSPDKVDKEKEKIEKGEKNEKAEKSSKNSAVEKENSPHLPPGWTRKDVVRKSGKTAGQVDIYIYSPDGIKFRSKPDVAAYLRKTKSNLKLDDFDFSKKKITSDVKDKVPVAKSKAPKEKKAKSEAIKKGSKLLVKLNFSPKNRKYKRHVLSASETKAQSHMKKNAEASGSKSKKKKA